MSIISNKEELAATPLRKDALDILEAGYESIKTDKVLKEKIYVKDGAICVGNVSFTCSFYERIFFVGIGKCAFEGAKVMEDILGEYLTEGIALDVRAGELKKIRSYAGTHPYPSETNVSVTERILEMLESPKEKDLIITLISGGGSSLFCLPHNIRAEALVDITERLTKGGADIFELNTVRKHLSDVQGGRLARLCFPAQIVSLIFSDVLGNDISMVASGPTVMDVTTLDEAKRVLEKYGITEALPLIETPKEQEFFKNIKNIMVVSNNTALSAMKAKAEELGFSTVIETETLSGDASEMGVKLATRETEPKKCVLMGGETTVKIKNASGSEGESRPQSGQGGRNQAMALSALEHMKPGCVLICAASDGWDNTDHAGALVDRELFEKAKEVDMAPQEFLERSDSYDFFKRAGGAIYTGKLGSNVSDLYIILYK